jgi:hypothetical protein
MSALATALDYAARGFAVFPCLERRKEPACSRGFHDATTNPATIRRWFSGPHNYNVAIATGTMSGIWVLDVDGEHGDRVMADLERQHGELPPTAEVITGRGVHLWFRADGPIPSSVERIGPSVDVRGDGGYVVAPPSIHPMGCAYEWANDRPPAPAPEWLVKLARHKPGAPKLVISNSEPVPHLAHRGPSDAYGQAALDREIDELAKTPPGSRNHALNRASFSLHQLVAGGELDAGEVRHRLIAAATVNGLMAEDGPRQVWATINSGARAGLQHPRSRPMGARSAR